MRTAGHRPGDDRKPALAAALALHLGLLAILLWRPVTPPAIGGAVPITIIAHAPTTDSRPAVQAPVTQTAQTQTPAPEAKAPEPPPPPPPPRPRIPEPKAEAPAPQPRPSPTRTARAPQPTPKETAKASPPHPAPKQTSKAASQNDSFSLDSLQADVAKSLSRAKPHPSFAARGPTRPETATVARVAAGSGVSQSDVAGLAQLLTRLWNVNCNAEEAVVIPVKFSVGDDGGIIGRVDVRNLDQSADGSVSSAARRAIDAVHKAAPYGPAFRNNSFTVNFDARKACANG
jgi:outer membrane biosynthesis protein TonB